MYMLSDGKICVVVCTDAAVVVITGLLLDIFMDEDESQHAR